jgi:hypothetical protein
LAPSAMPSAPVPSMPPRTPYDALHSAPPLGVMFTHRLSRSSSLELVA